ncbi:hypothetical protein LTR37_000582 [Vermiconidia calcicola]|uniref:Uncharacterized protein n=1 Tax=Vermiconidia calcicola TaxID=1690605 RepID=A0ACC3NYL7_9PEZI|nr:hypothetical protein LTR37_000582 [Vermiconidia calcicola]
MASPQMDEEMMTGTVGFETLMAGNSDDDKENAISFLKDVSAGDLDFDYKSKENSQQDLRAPPRYVEIETQILST